MFAKKTVFVVGAGASAEYRMPLGNKFTDRIATNLTEIIKADNNQNHNETFVRGFRTLYKKHGREFIRCVRQFQGGVRYASSIDRFLNFHNQDLTAVDIGKYSISFEVLRSEAESSMMTNNDGLISPEEINANSPYDWLRELFIHMQEDVTARRVENVFNNIIFICFNYDRCIEHYLFHAVREFAMLDNSSAASALGSLTIHHPYGRIGRLSWPADPSEVEIPFGGVASFAGAADRSAENIRTFAEERKDPASVEAIRAAMRDAEQIIFLGFSFLDQNMGLLTPGSNCEAKSILATTYMESAPNVGIARTLIDKMLKGRNFDGRPPGGVTLDASKAGVFMHENGRALRA